MGFFTMAVKIKADTIDDVFVRTTGHLMARDVDPNTFDDGELILSANTHADVVEAVYAIAVGVAMDKAIGWPPDFNEVRAWLADICRDMQPYALDDRVTYRFPHAVVSPVSARAIPRPAQVQGR